MQFLIRARDGAGMLGKRLEVRPKHLENLANVEGRILCAGGLLDEAGNMKGAAEENVMDCVVCGSCSFICPAHRNLTAAFKAMKDKIAAEAKKGKG